MKQNHTLLATTLLGWLIVHPAFAQEDFKRWAGRFDIGGMFFEDSEIKIDGSSAGAPLLKLDPGVQMDMAAEYRLTPWLSVGPELGFTFNYVDSMGDRSLSTTWLLQLLMMANVRVEYPPEARLAPFAGVGIGGVAGFLTIGGSADWCSYDCIEPDGSANSITLAGQAFAGLRYRVSDNFNLGLVYRYLITDEVEWDIRWQSDRHTQIDVDSIRMHSICLVLSGSF